MDPFSIATGCVGLLAAVAQLSTQVTNFASSFSSARRDLDRVLRELASLGLCLETLKDASAKLEYPDALRADLMNVLKDCGSVTTEMESLLCKVLSGNLLRRIEWTVKEKAEMEGLRSCLERHKSVLEIALDTTTVYVYFLPNSVCCTPLRASVPSRPGAGVLRYCVFNEALWYLLVFV